MINEINYERHPLISLVNIGITVFASLLGAPFALILTWKIGKYSQFYMDSIQIRVQILAWILLLTDILLMNIYLLYRMFLASDKDSPQNATLYSYVVHEMAESALEFDDRIIFGKFQ